MKKWREKSLRKTRDAGVGMWEEKENWPREQADQSIPHSTEAVLKADMDKATSGQQKWLIIRLF